MIKSADIYYININVYRPLSGSSYIELLVEINHLKKGSINIQNKNDEKYFR